MDHRKLKNAPGVRKAKLPQFIPTQLATLVKESQSGDEWLHELKFDGYPILCRIDSRSRQRLEAEPEKTGQRNFRTS